MDDHGGTSFVIRSLGLHLTVTGGCHLFAPTVLAVELWGTWAGILYARRILQAEYLILKGDSTIIISWIREAIRTLLVHPLLRDIIFLLQGCSVCIVRHVYREANSAIDWVVSFVAHHSGEVLWTHLGDVLGSLQDFVFSDFLGCIHT